jgi:hypothetical protein
MVSAPRSSQSGCFRSQQPPSLQTLVNSLLREGSTWRHARRVLLGRASERAKSWLARQKHSARKLERQEDGFSVGTVFIRSFGVWFLHEIRRYKSIEKCHGRSVAALRERNLTSKWIHEL